MGTIVLSMEKMHSVKDLNRGYQHNFRFVPLENADPEMEEFNRELVERYVGLTYAERFKARKAEVEAKTGAPLKYRKDAVLAFEVVLGFSRDANGSFDVGEWAEESYAWAKETFGEDNVVSAVLHMDEETPHLHVIAIPIDERNRLCAKSFTGGSWKLREWHDTYAAKMRRFGLRRGQKFSRAKHSNLHIFYTAIEKAANQAVPERLPDEPVELYAKRVQEFAVDQQMIALGAKEDAIKKVGQMAGKGREFYEKYRDAIELQDAITASFGGDEVRARERVRTYASMERAIPRKSLATFLESMLQKFPEKENIGYIFHHKKKKKKKPEGLQEVMGDLGETFMDNSNY